MEHMIYAPLFYAKISSKLFMKALVIYQTVLYDNGVANKQKLTYKNRSKKLIYRYWKGGSYDSGN